MQWWASEMLPALHGLLRLRFNDKVLYIAIYLYDPWPPGYVTRHRQALRAPKKKVYRYLLARWWGWGCHPGCVLVVVGWGFKRLQKS
jgi:hypothetical protein